MRLLPLLILLPTLAYAQVEHRWGATGFVVNQAGDIITNEHVVRGCQVISVGDAGREMPANLVFSDAGRDLALLRTPVAPRGGFAALRQNIEDLRPGDTVAVVGYAGQDGLAGVASFSKTILLGLHGPQGEPDQFQLFNVIDHGSSGGPVFDRAGRVIGVVTGITLKFREDEVSQPGAAPAPTAQIANMIALPALQQFLREHKVGFESAPHHLADKSDAMLAADAAKFILPVHCTHY